MACDCCGPPVPATEPVAALIAAPDEETSSSGDDAECLETKDLSEGEPNREQLGDCCPSGKYRDNKSRDDTDAPDCCRGKLGPCCDTSCLDRLAMRECEMSGVASGAGSETKSE